ncbi:MAG TPA: hypothetical protein VFO49_00930 [Nocardioides sp.]|nr:hypothetical protein [Nocardioides sp.]
MTSWLERGLACAIVVPFVIGFSVAEAESPPAEEVCRFQDPQIVESSGLVARDGLFFTVNDSGDSGRVFVVDARTCRTVGGTDWSDEVEDVEAVAPVDDGVLVGDIGDNLAARESVRLLQVPAGRGERTVLPTTYEITYPGGPRDAEALLVQPGTGQVLIASKGLMAGMLYAAPKRLSESAPNRVRPVADVPGLVTDGAFFPDGRHFVLRTYGRAVVYTYPGFESVGDITLPEQEQGEGIAVDEQGRIFVSSEGQRAPVLRIDLPRRVERAMAPPVSEPASPAPDTVSPGGEPAPAPDPERDAWPWLLGGGVGLLIVVFLLRALRPR